jgi:hypothetical protein
VADEAVVGAEGAAVETGALVESEPTEGATGVVAEAGQEEPSDDLYTVVVGGKEQKVTFEDLQKGYMRTADYTRKTQELAREREAVAELQALRTALERDPRTTLVALAGALGVDMGTAAQVAQAVQQGDQDPLEILSSKFDQLSSTLTAQQQAAQAAQHQAQQQAAALAQLEQETQNLKEQHGDFDERALYTYARDHGVVNLDVAYRAWQFELAKEHEASQRNAALEAKRKAQVVDGGRSVAPGSTAATSSPKMSVREAYRIAAASVQ